MVRILLAATGTEILISFSFIFFFIFMGYCKYSFIRKWDILRFFLVGERPTIEWTMKIEANDQNSDCDGRSGMNF